MKELSLYILDITMNSVKAGAKNISISLGEYDGIFSFSVEDDGCGMTPETMRHIYDKFYQGDSSHATHGNGLGLALVKRIADAHDAELTVKSGVGKGTTVRVRFQ